MVSCRCRLECWGLGRSVTVKVKVKQREMVGRWVLVMNRRAWSCWVMIQARQNVSSHARHSLVIDLRQEWCWSSCYIQHTMQRTSLIRTQSYCYRTLIMRHSVSIMVATTHNKIYHKTFVPSLIFAGTNWYYLIVHARIYQYQQIMNQSWLVLSGNKSCCFPHVPWTILWSKVLDSG